ncbi:hypothetical protein QA645_40845 [Bradyrhizobium sp. CIAT3101]|uniref:hypothetical protein n=1 Tax=Bradyrhizobium sp. CIAT3101 TaxID=439387 RepID=UPI0024B1A2EE|nr:hypothetical protein [Bradyrhizobium sp. CIAT3101]WFU80702.1 hypothetical protein QA645_40845 [Bradyrhizobium sp. CIAT3101]
MAKRTLKTRKSSPGRAKPAKKGTKKAKAARAPAKTGRKKATGGVKDPLPGGDPFEL